ncbi:MAG: hypothetical protein JW913_15815 [Chitinispirillaceae bacterium]|nr:hypothetical protein [Chitinispirillaceae bacterium]
MSLTVNRVKYYHIDLGGCGIIVDYNYSIDSRRRRLAESDIRTPHPSGVGR